MTEDSKPPIQPKPISHIIMGDPAQPRNEWKYSAGGWSGRTPVHAGARWVYMPWVAAIGTTLAVGWPFLFHGVARVVCAVVWYALVVTIGVLVLVSRAKPQHGPASQPGDDEGR